MVQLDIDHILLVLRYSHPAVLLAVLRLRVFYDGIQVLLLGGGSRTGAGQASVLRHCCCRCRLPAFASMPLSDQEEDEEAEQQDEGH